MPGASTVFKAVLEAKKALEEARRAYHATPTKDALDNIEKHNKAFVKAYEKLGVDPTAHTVSSYNALAKSIPHDPVADAAHASRGNLGYLSNNAKQPVSTTDLVNAHKELKTAQDQNNSDAAANISEWMQENVPADQMDHLLSGNDIVLDRPLYVTRNSNFARDSKDMPKPHHRVSASVVEPTATETPYMFSSDNNRVYKLEPGTVISHPKGTADPNEVVVHQGFLDQAQQLDQAQYSQLIKAGKAPFIAAGAAVAAGTQSDNADASPVLPKSLLTEVVSKLPKDFKMKAASVVNYLKKRGVKQEELDFSGVAEKLSGMSKDKRVTAKELQELDSNRTDNLGKITAFNKGKAVDRVEAHTGEVRAIPPLDVDFGAYITNLHKSNYSEDIITYSSAGNLRDVYNHWPDTPEYAMHARVTDGPLNGLDTRVVQEMQSDLFQTRRQYGATPEIRQGKLVALEDEIAAVTEKIKNPGDIGKVELVSLMEKRRNLMRAISAQEQILAQDANRADLIASSVRPKSIAKYYEKDYPNIAPDAPFESNWLAKNLDFQVYQAGFDGKQALAVPLDGFKTELARGDGVQRWYESRVRSTMKKKVKQLNSANGYKGNEGFQYKEYVSDPLDDSRFLQRNLTFNASIPDRAALTREILSGSPKEVKIAKERARSLIGSNADLKIFGQIIFPKRVAQDVNGATTYKAPKWLDSIKLYTAAGVAAGAAIQTQDAKAWMRNLPDNVSLQSIDKALSAKGVTTQNVIDYLVSNRGVSKDTAERVVDRVMRNKVELALKAGHNAEEVTKYLKARGVSEEDIARYLPSDSVLESIYKQVTNIGQTLVKIFPDGAYDSVKDELMTNGIQPQELSQYQPPEVKQLKKQAKEVAARAIAANETVPAIWGNPFGLLSREWSMRAKTESEALNTHIKQALTLVGVDATVDKEGNIYVPDSNGNPALLDVSTVDLLLARKLEMLGGVTGGILAAKLTKHAPWYVKGSAVLAGSAIGTATGRGADMMRNWLYTKQELDGRLLWDEMLATGASDAIFSAGLGTAFKVTGATAKALYKAYDHVLGGNIEGANKALLEFLHITPDEAANIVKQWEKLAGKKAPGFTQASKNLHVLPKTVADGYAIISPASAQSSRMSITVSKEIATRAADIHKELNAATGQRIGAILYDELPKYETKVKDTFTAVKNFGIEQMKDSSERFNFKKIIDLPLLERKVLNIHTPAYREVAERLVKKVKALGDVEKDGVVVANKHRKFADLLELRTVINKLGSVPSLSNADDIAMIVKMRKNIDKNITKMVRKELGTIEGNAWLKEWKAVNKGYQNMLNLKNQSFIKAVNKGALTDKQIAKKLMQSAMSVGSSYRELLQATPIKMQAPLENAVIREVVNKYTIGPESGKQAIDFVALHNQLKLIPFATKEARDMRRALGEFAKVFKNDPAVLSATGAVKSPAFQTFLATDPTARLKYEFITSIFNYGRRLVPGQRGREVALVMAAAKALEKPNDAQTIAKVISKLPKDPDLQNQLKAKLLEIAKWSEKSTFPKVSIYRSAAHGHSRAVTDGPLGKGVYYHVDKTKARSLAKLKNGKLSSTLINPERIADDFVIKEILGLPDSFKVTPKFVKAHPELRKQLEARMYNGLIVADTVLIF